MLPAVARAVRFTFVFFVFFFLTSTAGVADEPWRKHFPVLGSEATEEVNLPLDEAGLKKFFEKVGSPAALMKALPAELRARWLLLSASESAQPATPERPRVVLFSEDTIVALPTDREASRKAGAADVEIIRFDRKAARFIFSSVRFEDGKAKVVHDDRSCNRCHGPQPRPNFDAYDSWPHLLAFNRDRLYQGSEEEKAFRRILETLGADPVVGALALPENVKREKLAAPTAKSAFAVTVDWNRGRVTSEDERTIRVDGHEVKQGGNYLVLGNGRSDEGAGISFFTHLTDLNGGRIGGELAGLKDLARYRPLVAAANAGCFDGAPEQMKDFVSAAEYARRSRHFGVADFAALDQKTREARKAHPAAKARLQRATLAAMLRANDEYEGLPAADEQTLQRRATAELRRRNEVADRKKLDVSGTLVDREVQTERALMAALRFALEPDGVPVRWWSLSVRERASSFTFGDARSQEGFRNVVGLLAGDAEAPERDAPGFPAWCAARAKESAAVLAAPPPAPKPSAPGPSGH